MKSMCIVQITRFGDLIQTYQAALGMKQHRPDVQLHLVARKQFATPLMFLLNKVFDKIHTIDLKSIVTPELNTSLQNIQNTLTEINQTRFDVLVNLSFSKSSSYLSSLINARYKLGPYRNELGELAIEDKWSQYIFSSVMTNIYNPYNLVEIYKNILGTRSFSQENSSSRAQQKSTVVCLHPFASDDKKSWTSYKWVETIYGLSKLNPGLTFAVMGSENEVEAAEKITSHPMLADIQVQNMAGKSTLEQSAEIISGAVAFIGNDSMLSHLAAVYKTPTLTISLGPVRPHESVPYQANAITLSSTTSCYPCKVETSCDILTCHKDIPYNVAVTLADALIKGKEIDYKFIKSSINVFHLSNLRIYKSKFDKDQNFILEEISNPEMDYNNVLRLINRVVFDLYISNKDFKTSIPSLSSKTAQKLVEDLKIITQLYEVYGHGMAFTKRLASAIDTNEKEITTLVSRIQEVEKLALTTKGFSPASQVIIDFFTTSLKNSSGQSLREITQSYQLGFLDASNLTAMLFELIQQMVSPYVKTKGPEPVV